MLSDLEDMSVLSSLTLNLQGNRTNLEASGFYFEGLVCEVGGLEVSIEGLGFKECPWRHERSPFINNNPQIPKPRT